MIIMPHSQPAHRCSSQARQTSGTPHDQVAALNAELSAVEAQRQQLRDIRRYNEVVSFALDEDLAHRLAWPRRASRSKSQMFPKPGMWRWRRCGRRSAPISHAAVDLCRPCVLRRLTRLSAGLVVPAQPA